jgi:hypothetical protein
MGGIVSAGEDNDELVDNLVEAGAVRSARIEKALRSAIYQLFLGNRPVL